MKKIVVFRTGHLGDSICAIPSFRLIREHYPDAQLILLSDETVSGKVSVNEVIAELGIFDELATYRSGRGFLSYWRMFWTVRRLGPDLLIALPQERESLRTLHRKRLFLRATGVNELLGFSEANHMPEWRDNEPSRLINLLRQHGIEGGTPKYAIPVNEAARLSVKAALIEAGVEVNSSFLVFCGGGKVSTQRWPLERYASVLDSINQQLNLPIIALGNAKELTAYRQEIGGRFDRLIFLNRNLSLPEIFELLRLATAYIGNDTGPMHMAAAVECPVAVVMSARNAPGAWDPDVTRRLIVRKRLACEGCFLTECVDNNHECLAGIDEESVRTQVLGFLQDLVANGNHSSPIGMKEAV
ncbi:MAG: glycosyl transferase family 9 [Chthoniobacteraceae bacterium]|nr:glycosyl transferase family 9 [Chthoniobacteraceae bacterium]